MGIYTRYTTAVLTLLLLAIATASTARAATIHPVPSIAKALAAGPSGVMPSGLTVQRSQQLGVMLLKANTQLALGSGAVVPVTRGASLSVGALARGAVTVLKNSSPPKLIGSAVIAGAIALLPGAKVHEGELIRSGESSPVDVTYWIAETGSGSALQTHFAGTGDACRALSNYSHIYLSPTNDPNRFACHGTYSVGTSGPLLGYIQKVSYSCDYGIDSNKACLPVPSGDQYVPFGPADWDDLEAAIPASDPSPGDVQDFWFDLCDGNGACMGSYTSDPTLDGPASVQGPKTTTTSTGPNGTTTTTRDTQHDLDYSNPDGVVVRDRTTTTTTYPDGNTTTDTTVDDGPVVGAKPEDNLDLDGSFTDTPFPEVEPFYEQKYPDGLEGVWAARKAEFEDSAFMDFLGSFVPSFSGSCPAWSFNVNVASWAQFGIHDFQSLCWVFDFVKVVLLVSAAFLCRALIFGG